MDKTDYKEQFLKSMEMHGMTGEEVKKILDDALRHSKMTKEELEAERKTEIENIEREAEELVKEPEKYKEHRRKFLLEFFSKDTPVVRYNKRVLSGEYGSTEALGMLQVEASEVGMMPFSCLYPDIMVSQEEWDWLKGKLNF